MLVKLEASWLAVLKPEFDASYMQNLRHFLLSEKNAGKIIYPPNNLIFNAFEITPWHNVKVVILGQDPYHGQGQAHGLSFSVQKGVAIPPSLKNIYNELATDISDFTMPPHGNLTYWAQQGVLMLNATLTVAANAPGSHQKAGWETFTNQVIKTISAQKENVVFILWGKFAQAKAAFIDENKHFIIKSAHPSPFSVYQGFYGSQPFSQTNAYLKSKEIKEIDWQIV
ncbi:MAG: uracil-DNA glycosylase [Sphingobacteriales bacterium]|nr:MAG: uracil-DNA glycosylase [Sphingobacteriales bacterium]TAF80867.1 MAG: uracil-DNA glycosylase [Sphingobacteriales bacterium]